MELPPESLDGYGPIRNIMMRKLADEARQKMEYEAMRAFGFGRGEGYEPPITLVALARAAEKYMRDQSEENLLELSLVLDHVPEKWRLTDQQYKEKIMLPTNCIECDGPLKIEYTAVYQGTKSVHMKCQSCSYACVHDVPHEKE